MKAFWYVVLVLVFSLYGAGILSASYFIDEFDRPDGPVGNDWIEMNDGGLSISIENGQLAMEGTQAGDWAANSISRDVTGLGEFKSVHALTRSTVLHPELFVSNADTGAYLATSASHGWHFVYTVSPDGGWYGWVDPPTQIVLGEDWTELGIVQTAPGVFKITINDEVTVDNVEALDEVTHIRINATVEAGVTDTMLVEYVEVNREDAAATTPMC